MLEFEIIAFNRHECHICVIRILFAFSPANKKKNAPISILGHIKQYTDWPSTISAIHATISHKLHRSAPFNCRPFNVSFVSTIQQQSKRHLHSIECQSCYVSRPHRLFINTQTIFKLCIIIVYNTQHTENDDLFRKWIDDKTKTKRNQSINEYETWIDAKPP